MLSCMGGSPCDLQSRKGDDGERVFECGSNIAIPYFVSFIFFCSFLVSRHGNFLWVKCNGLPLGTICGFVQNLSNMTKLRFHFLWINDGMLEPMNYNLFTEPIFAIFYTLMNYHVRHCTMIPCTSIYEF